jgi:DNA-binding response OmpR family regulator
MKTIIQRTLAGLKKLPASIGHILHRRHKPGPEKTYQTNLLKERGTASTPDALSTLHGHKGESGCPDENHAVTGSLPDQDCRSELVHAVILGNSASVLKHTANSTEKLRVLICEDDDEIAVLSEFLLRHAGFEIEQAEDAETARELIKSGQHDIMILDLGLPGMDGLSFIRELEEGQINIPVIVVSANASQVRDSLHSPPAFVVDWIDKPVDQQQLVNSVLLGVQTASITGRRILHVEDDPDIISLVQVMLDDTWEVIPAMSIYEGRNRLADEHFDLVLLDLNLPDGSGLDLLPDIRALKYPVAIFSEKELSDSAFDAFDATLVKSKTTRAGLLKTLLDLTEVA